MSNSNRTNVGQTMIPEYGAHVPEDKDQYLVKTPYGPGLVLRTRKPKHLQSKIKIARNVTDRNGSEVVIMREIELTGWSISQNGTDEVSNRQQDDPSTKNCIDNTSGRPIRPAMLYTSIDYPTITPQIGSDVICPYGFGRGRVVELRNALPTMTPGGRGSDDSDESVTSTLNTDTTTFVVVRLSSWRLAGRNTVVCTFHRNTVRTVRHQHIYEMSIVEKIEYANTLKQTAAIHFSQKDYSNAIRQYERAVNAVKFVQHGPNSTNVIRADLLLVMITCCNNSATCYLQLLQQQQQHNPSNSQSALKHEYFEKAYQHAQQALSLTEAMEGKKGGRIHQELLKLDSCNDARMFGEWKVKSLYIIAYVFCNKYDRIDEANSTILKARDIIASAIKITVNDHHQQQHLTKLQAQLRKKDRELIKLYHQCKERQKELLKIEKLRAQAMFAKSKPPAITSSSSKSTTTESSPPHHDNGPIPPPTTTSNRRCNNDDNLVDEEKKSDSMFVPVSSFDRSKNDTNTNRLKDDHDDIADLDHDINNDPTISQDDDIPWHQDPYVLTGLGVIIGTIGTLLVLSQLLVQPTPNKR